MLSNAVILFSLVLTTLVINIDANGTKDCSPNFCDTVRCRNQSPDECSEIERLQPRDTSKCRCCDQCTECDAKICQSIRCAQAVCKAGEEYVPRDGKCTCCPYCRPCDPTLCQRVDCFNRDKDDCKPDETFVPSDGLCTCCSYCKKNNE